MSTGTRPRAARKSREERAREIADEARSIALEQGLSAVTLRAIAARAGVTAPLVSHYEPNMDALVASTFTSITTQELDEVVSAAEAAATPVERLSLLLDASLDGARQEVTVVWVEAWALGRRNETLATAVREQMDAWQSVFVLAIEAGVESGDFRAADPDGVAWQLLGMVDGINAQALVRWGETRQRGTLMLGAAEGMLGLRPGALAPTR